MTRTGFAALCLLALPFAAGISTAGERVHATVKLTAGGVEVSTADGCMPRTVVAPPGGLFQGTATARLDVNDRGEVTGVTWEPAAPPKADLAEKALRRWRFDPQGPCPKTFRVALDFPDSEFWDYARDIYERGGTDEASEALWTIAQVRAGVLLLEFEPQKTGVYRKRYTNTYCVRSDDSQAEAMEREIRQKTRAEADRLRRIADRDGSGFVSTREGGDLKRSYELGQLVALLQKESSPDPLAQRVLRAFPGAPPQEIQEQYDDYLALRAKDAGFGPATPRLDFSTVAKVR
jgi:hypothetical protein